ncbi:hypothetical protein EC988_008156, partial [Linderina pennispora]
REVDDLVRMHLHLAERINNEVVRPLHVFLNTDAWKVALEIEGKIRTMASEMQSHHESIPKLSARTVSKSAKTSQQAAQKLEDEKRSLMQLQEQWQSTISTLVEDFETADVARVELIRDAVFKFEHYRSEFLKKGLSGVASAVEVATNMTTSPQIAAVLNSPRNMEPADVHSPQPAAPVTSAEQSPANQASVLSPASQASQVSAAPELSTKQSKGFLKFNL